MALAIDSFPTGLDKVLVSDADTGIAGEMLRVTAALMGALAIASGACSIRGPLTPERHSSHRFSIRLGVRRSQVPGPLPRLRAVPSHDIRQDTG